jgi:hypothetical protein
VIQRDDEEARPRRTCVAFCAFFARLPPLPAVVAATDGTVEGDGVDGGSAPAIQ